MYTLLTLALAANVAQSQLPATDHYGDPLPPGVLARLGTTRFRHNAPIVFAAFLPDGKSIVSISSDSVTCVWKFPSGQEIRRFEAHPAKDRPATPMPRSTSKFGGGVRALVNGAALSPDGKYLTVFCNDGFLRIWDLANSEEPAKVANAGGQSGSAGPAHSPDGKTLLLFGSSRVLQLVDLPNGKETGPDLGHIMPLTAIWFTPDGGQVLTKDNQITHVWNAATGKDLGPSAIKLPAGLGLSTIIISPDGRAGVAVARFSSAAEARAAETREAVLFDTASGKELATIELEAEPSAMHRKPIVFAPDNQVLAVCLGADKNDKERIALYEVASGKLLRTLDGGPPAPPAKVIKGGKGPPGGGFQPKGAAAKANAQKLLFSPDGKVLAFQAGPAATIVLLDTVTGRKVGAVTPVEGSAAVLQGAFSTDGRGLFLATNDGRVVLYELATGQSRHTYAQRLRRSPVKDDLLDRLEELGLGGGGFLDSVDISTLLARLTPRLAFAVAPDGKLLAVNGPGGGIRLFDVLTGVEVTVLKGHTAAVNALAFAPHGKTLASASDDTTALIWDVTHVKRPASLAKIPEDADLESWWKVLAADDAARAFAALADFVAAPKQAVAWIEKKVKPAAAVDGKRVQDLIAQMDDNQYKVRDKASSELFKLGEQIVPDLDNALNGKPSPEARKRLEELRAKLTGWMLHGERLRAYRAVEILERIGTPEARQLLQALANGAPGALLTTSAQAALKR
jgi:WD40 repeat protein